MKSCSERWGFARSLVALSVSLAVVLSTPALSFAAFAKSAAGPGVAPGPTAPSQGELQLTSVIATKTTTGVLLQWHADSNPDNLGFNVYRVRDGRRVRANRQIIPGALFAPKTPLLQGGDSYAWLDRAGTADSVYYIESVNAQGATKVHDAVRPVAGASTLQAPAGINPSAAESITDMFEKYYPAAESEYLNLPSGPIENQWAIAAQSALKIGIKKDGWYRVTQSQMAAAGFNPSVDIRNLQLFVDGQELAIGTSQSSGRFGASDYIEFYGRGLDVPTTDTRTYYLIAGTTPGKRVSGDFQPGGDPDPTPVPTATPPPSATPTPVPVSTPPPTPVTSPPPATQPPATRPPATQPPVTSPPQVLSNPKSETAVLRDPVFYSWVQRDLGGWLDSSTNRAANGPRVENSRPSDSQSGSSQLYNASPDASYSPSARTEETDDRPADSARAVVSPKTVANAVDDGSREHRASEKSAAVKSPGPNPSEKQPAVKAARANQFRKASKASRNRKRSRRLRRQPRQARQERSHALLSVASAPGNFEYTSERKDRGLYFVNLLNGDAENFFGQVVNYIPPPNAAGQTISCPNPDLTAVGPARLEVAIQGVNQNLHQVSVEFNGVLVGSFPIFFGFDPASGGHQVKVFDVPVSQLQNGANTIRFVVNQPPSGSSDTTIVDYVKLTYPHSYNADAGALRFTLRGTQTRTVDGFATPLVRLIDYTDPFNVIVEKPQSEPTASGHAITVPLGAPVSKAPRLLYAIPQNQFEVPASLSLNQPSTLNQGNLSATATNGADFLIVSYKDFISSFSANVTPANTSLIAQRQSQGLTPATVDIEDVYDEFGYGVHGPQALRAFLLHAATRWVTKPRYVILAGDASLDPRNYTNAGNSDLVPTKLVDATYSETASDDWMTDFDDDGVGDVPVGRMPFRTVGQAAVVLSKIVNFTPVVPQSALLVADEDPFHIYGFVETNDLFQSLLPPGTLVTRINRPPGNDPNDNAQVKAAIIAGFNEGPALVNYSGHGNVNIWTSSSLFHSNDAAVLTNLQNHNKLSFVVVMDCLNGYFQDPNLFSLSEALLEAPNGGAVAAFASSGLTIAQGQHEMGRELYTQLYGGAPMKLGDAIKLAKTATFDIDVKRTWIFFGDPSLNIR